MRVFALIVFTLFCLTSCKTTRHATIVTKKETSKKIKTPDSDSSISEISRNEIPGESSTYEIASAIIENARSYNGVRYKFGGTSSKGMDCSGLVYVSFNKENVLLPRISRDMAKKGKSVRRSEVQKGDLLFFKTGKKRGTINHVGLVTNSGNGSIEFIHATTSKGVITSTLKETYWNSAFVEARRIL